MAATNAPIVYALFAYSAILIIYYIVVQNKKEKEDD